MRASLIFTNLFLTLGLSLVSFGCGIDRQYEKYPDMIRQGSVALTQANHPHGWGRKDCFACHVASNIHLVDQGFGFNPSGLSKDPNGCVTCHTNNGVSP